MVDSVYLHEGILPVFRASNSNLPELFKSIDFLLETEIFQCLFQIPTSQQLSSELLHDVKNLKKEVQMNFFLQTQSIDKRFFFGKQNAFSGYLLPKIQNHPKEILFGTTVSSFLQAEIAENQGADFLVFTAETLSYDDIEELREMTAVRSIPVFASGAITTENLIQIKDSGAYGFLYETKSLSLEEMEHHIHKLKMLWEDIE